MSIFDDNLSRLKKVQELESISEVEMSVLYQPILVNQADLDINGKVYPAWRIIFNNDLGPGKGGIRFHPDVSPDEVQSLAFWMALKNSLADIPYGGAKGGVKFNPKEASLEELELVSRRYIDAFYKDLGQDKDIPAPDVYTNPQIMSWMLDQYEKNVGHHEPGMITGKPVELGGLALRSDSTAKGGYIVTKEAAAKFLPNQSEKKVVIQGFGNAGLYMTKMLFDDDYKIIAVSDSQGGIYAEDGLDINAVIEHKQAKNPVGTFPNVKTITNAELLELETDILVLAALENQINKDNAQNIKAKCIVELANGPITAEADEILFANNIPVVPDILANSGGVIVSYFEWAQNRAGSIIDNDYLASLLEKKMKNNWFRVYSKYEEKEKKVNLRTAAYILAIKRILTAAKLRGRIK